MIKMKHQKIGDFPEEITAKQIKKMKDWPPAGNWRAFKMLRINYTYLNQVWKNTQNSRTVKETYVAPFGMVKTLSIALSHKKCYDTFNVLTEQVKSELNFMEETFNKEFVSLDVLHEGSKGYAEFNYIYCTYCTQNKLPEVLNQNKDKLPVNPKIENLLEKWDKIKLSNSLLDLCGCLLPNEVHVKSAPNATHFIVRLSEHASSCHMPSKSSKSSTSTTPPTKQTTLIIKEDRKVSTAKPAATSVSKNK